MVQVVGHTGFIGRHLFRDLSVKGVAVAGVSRRTAAAANLADNQSVGSNDLVSIEDGSFPIASGARTLVFAAGLAHIQRLPDDQLSDYENINSVLPVNYALAAISAGVRRFIYLSSIGVCGDGSLKRYTAESETLASDPYSRSKLLAELKLKELFASADADLVIVRPPMVYGPQAPGNYSRLVSLVEKGFPLPFGALDNPRSFISIQNLVSFLVHCIDHPAASGRTFVISDNDDTTTCDFVREIAKAQGHSVKLLPVPRWLFVAGLTLLGKGKAARKLSAPLTVDCSYAMKTLDWRPPYSLREGLRMSFEKDYTYVSID